MPPTTRSIHAVYAEGMEAREADQPVTACPYPADSNEHAHWVDGWHEPDALDEDQAPDDPIPGGGDLARQRGSHALPRPNVFGAPTPDSIGED